MFCSPYVKYLRLKRYQDREGGFSMKQVIAATCLAAAFAVGISAQTYPPQSQPPTQEAKDAARTLTVTGCLKAGDSADSFILSDLKWNKGDKAVGTSGAPAAPPQAIASATALKLIGSPKGTKLSEHVGHTVEVTGTISEKADKGMGSPTPADPAAPKPSATAKADPTFSVRTVKMVSATCSM